MAEIQERAGINMADREAVEAAERGSGSENFRDATGTPTSGSRMAIRGNQYHRALPTP